jgi:hypothetical protein
MNQQEKGSGFDNHEAYDAASLEKLREKNHEVMREKLERANERHREENESSARREALETATSRDKETAKREREDVRGHEQRPRTRREKEASYNRTMDEVKSQLSAPSRVFSDFIHNPVVEKVSDAIGGTVARPNAVLSGSIFAFLFTLVVYLVARYYGYPLSGSETIASFFLGWVLGLIVDYVRLLVFGKTR